MGRTCQIYLLLSSIWGFIFLGILGIGFYYRVVTLVGDVYQKYQCLLQTDQIITISQRSCVIDMRDVTAFDSRDEKRKLRSSKLCCGLY
uniref:Uncharacterized protein n=1 Tax=Plectus sambesii TaxID=2011161 RepID=A0A914UN77_9BILA